MPHDRPAPTLRPSLWAYRQAPSSSATDSRPGSERHCLSTGVMAERVGFEPTDRLPGQRFSRPPHSTALAPLLVRRLRRMAERVGFEPTVEFPLHTLSKRAP